jgi:hypothetical protein
VSSSAIRDASALAPQMMMWSLDSGVLDCGATR